MIIIEVECQREAHCSLAVGMWNYWDHEHVTMMHKGFKGFQILNEEPNYVTLLATIRFPFLPFITYTTLNSMTLKDKNTILVHNTVYGIPAQATITITEMPNDKTIYHMKYEFYVNGWKKLFAPLLRRWLPPLITWWNQRQWREDLLIKMRRQKVLRYGFKDFKGLPDRFEDRTYEGPLECKLPVPRPLSSPVNRLKNSINNPG